MQKRPCKKIFIRKTYYDLACHEREEVDQAGFEPVERSAPRSRYATKHTTPNPSIGTHCFYKVSVRGVVRCIHIKCKQKNRLVQEVHMVSRSYSRCLRAESTTKKENDACAA